MKAPPSIQYLAALLLIAGTALAARQGSPSPDEAALADLIKSYYSSYADRDIPTLATLWSHRSPDMVAALQEAVGAVAAGQVVVSNIAISRVKIADNKAVLQASADFTFTGAQTKASRQEQRLRNFALIKEAAGWKVWREAPAAEDLSSFLEKGSEWKVSADSIEQFAATLVNSSEAERQRLLAENRQMITRALVDALTRKVGALQIPGGYDRAIGVLGLVKKIAEHLGDKEGMAVAEREIGDAFREWGRSSDAIRHYQEAVADLKHLAARAPGPQR